MVGNGVHGEAGRSSRVFNSVAWTAVRTAVLGAAPSPACPSSHRSPPAEHPPCPPPLAGRARPPPSAPVVAAARGDRIRDG
ncbi:hypothetical protein QYE76_032853 [Lolium multiflorum]|uniref:Uncharacterized protein n=1 Tax=Lolium multiflorum TaxID=4521 RepID=A0AAD8QU93_LOLMU|nr:hypothetical protein QYE76_032853 [Lolium multiflorum]